MKVIGKDIAEVFARKHPHSRGPLTNWHNTTKLAQWKSSADVKYSFRSANYVQSKKCWVFDISSNRLIAKIDFAVKLVKVIHVFTHSQYDIWCQKE